jgi:tetratricopeptide (TPR) repeat protein
MNDYGYAPVSRAGGKRLTAFLAVAFLVFGLFPLSALDFFAEGERLFRENKPLRPRPFFTKRPKKRRGSRVFVYLGLCYQQLGKYDDAISAFMKGAQARGADRKVLYYNAGNVYYLQGLWTEAERMYSRSIEADSAYAPAYVNRANSRVKLERFADAVGDYTVYLMLNPASPEKDDIQRLVALLTGEIKAREDEAKRAELARIAAEEERARLKRQEEEDAARREAERLAAAERYKKLMDEISGSCRRWTRRRSSPPAPRT